MRRRIKNKFILGLVILIGFISGCNSQSASPKDVSQRFWSAIQERDMEQAKIYATWDTVDYMKYLNSKKLHPERFDLGELMQGEQRAEVATVLFTSKQGESGIKLPGVTVLVKTDHGWRVNVKKTMTSVVKYTANNVFDQLNGLVQEGIKELDSSLSQSMNELGRVLEESTLELKKELSKPLFEPDLFKPRKDLVPEKSHSGQQI